MARRSGGGRTSKWTREEMKERTGEGRKAGRRDGGRSETIGVQPIRHRGADHRNNQGSSARLFQPGGGGMFRRDDCQAERHPLAATMLIVDLVDGGLLVPGARHDVLVVYGDVAAQHRGRLLRLRGGGTTKALRKERDVLSSCPWRETASSGGRF